MNTTVKRIAPGLVFASAIAILSMYLQNIPFIEKLHFSSLIIAIILGVLIKNLFKLPSALDDGIRFTLKKILRLAIIFLGFKLSFAQVVQIGGKGVLLVTIVTTCTILFAVWMGKRMGLDNKLSLLIGSGAGICGASAVAAIDAVIEADELDTTFAIATVTIFGTIEMFLYPVLDRLFHMPNLIYAVWSGSSIHEVAQVVAAGFAVSSQAGKFAVLVKLTRVLLIIPASIIIGVILMRQKKGEKTSRKKVTIPWFVFGFLAFVVINSLHIIPKSVISPLISIDTFLLTLAMVGMGLETSFEKMKKVGVKPFYVGFATSVFIGLLSYAVARVMF